MIHTHWNVLEIKAVTFFFLNRLYPIALVSNFTHFLSYKHRTIRYMISKPSVILMCACVYKQQLLIVILDL